MSHKRITVCVILNYQVNFNDQLLHSNEVLGKENTLPKKSTQTYEAMDMAKEIKKLSEVSWLTYTSIDYLAFLHTLLLITNHNI